MKTFRFLEFQVYQDARKFNFRIAKLTKFLQRQQEFPLADQLARCSLSVALNIAEGSAKNSDKEFARYLKISLGSLSETVACLDILCGQGIISQENFDSLFTEAGEIANQLGGFLKKLQNKK